MYYEKLYSTFKKDVKHYHNDFIVLDLEDFNKNPEGDFLWGTRESGTQLFHLEKGYDHLWFTYWESQYISIFHLKNGSVKKISFKEAKDIIKNQKTSV